MTERRAILINGIVQGVGFRPFVYGLAMHWGLGGFVRNDAGTVLIEVEGLASALDGFLGELTAKSPPLARVENVHWKSAAPKGEGSFRIEPSVADRAEQIFVSPDAAACDDCLKEMLDRRDRRFGYPFLNCTNCGPRLTIVTAAPYDRRHTTMADFAMCARARRNMTIPPIVVSTPSRRAAPSAGRGCVWWTGPGIRSRPMIRLASSRRLFARGKLAR